MVGIGTFPVHRDRARHLLLALGFVATAAIGALAATLFAGAAPAPEAAAPPAGAHVALYVQVQSWHALDQSAAHRLYLQTVLVNSGRDTASAPAVQDFTVRAEDGRIWQVTASGAGFPAGSLQPGEQRGLSMFVDLPASASSLRLVMVHQGQVESLPLVA